MKSCAGEFSLRCRRTDRGTDEEQESVKFTYPAELPVSAAKDEIAEAVRTHQVVIVSGQTGSGKTTQLPKILLELGRGTHGHQIVHTQPRRIAARTVAERIASEMDVRLGDEIGFQVRFTDESSPRTRLRVVTDGILLAQIQRDPKLSAYDTIIIDEAHERSLNIDFLLGYLTALLPQRRDLKLIITSATIDSVKFQEHFAKALHADVPVIEVSGRTYPVQVVYEPLGSAPALMHYVPGFERSSDDDDDADMDMPTAVARACAELVIHSSHEPGARDILVFASGERDIHDFESALRRHFGQRAVDMNRSDAIEIMPLFARLSAKEQHRVFEAHTHQRIVLATNVAETSLTVPGIRYVVDPGTARISRYSKAAKVQRLPIEPISQASADQRAGRCGRVADGIAIRLYDRTDYETRPRFTEPEILRTALASVVLHMLSVGVARTAEDVTGFGFIDPPDTRAVANGFNDLTELRAISRSRGRGDVRLTHIGRQLARLPIDVRLARMVVEAAKDTPNTLAAVLVVVAFLSLQDPRERPEDKREEADRIHNRYADESSDFLTALNIWDRFFQADGETSHSALRRLCKAEFMNYPRMRQWRDLYRQLVQMCRELKFEAGEPLPSSRPPLEVRQLPMNQQAAHSLTCSWDAVGIHKAMLSGLLSSIGMQQVREPKASDFAGLHGAARARAMKRAQKQSRNEYLGSRGTRFALFPASAVAKSTPQWVMAAELVETSRLWARSAAAIDPAWAEPLAGSLTRTTYAEPHWSASKGAAVASAKILLYGLPIVQDRTVQWGAINPVEARDFLIREGLVAGEVQQRFPYDDFIDDNRAVLEESGEETARTRHMVDRVTDEDLVDFYDAKLPADITSMAKLGAWWRRHHDEDPTLLDFDPSKVERLAEAEEVSLDDYPDHWHTLGSDGSPIDLKLSYVYDPQAENDGVTVHVPLKFLSRISPEQFTWNVPGLLDELIVAMIKSLPKALRVQFVPAPDTARKIRVWIDEHYDALPGSGEQGRPALAPVDETTGVAQWPDLRHVFTQAAIHVVGAQLHPEVFNEEQLARLPKHVRMTFVVEKPVASRNRRGRGRGRGPQRMTVLASSKSLADLQARFAEQAAESARQTVRKQATKAADQGKVVQSANLLHKAGATMVSRSAMLWKAALDALRLPDERISSRWLGGEALMLASAPYKNTKDLVEDLQLAAVKRLLPNVGKIRDDAQLADAVGDVTQVYEDTVYQLARDVIAALRRYAEVDKAVSGTASLPLLSVLQSIREHIGALVVPGFIGAMPPDALRSLERYLHADLLRLEKAKANKSRDVNWAWEVDEAQRLVDKAREQAGKLPAGPRHDEMAARVERARWMVEEFRVSLWAQELGTPKPVSLKRITKALKE
ncbi:ATP-dependent RNA helicase HrpA [Bifidobacterium sp. SMB2]|uniref:ATP-dependent RNA helicase HrpA n=1 Tax=Bifidobacterium saimiriisciurei TaxID=2661627 RepID=A0ABX0C9I9_9BIFI|nr:MULTISPECIES: ATP-dependent RNA helicase HrpA [Bifidobacterium]NEG95950.1 ATP-dependent RNA helicase HrpA [Bifidobacterium sp. SMB2]NEH11797.1 ATP-dependent RNA helicase HrpA [Bifidobacterium saimiriisciurei]